MTNLSGHLSAGFMQPGPDPSIHLPWNCSTRTGRWSPHCCMLFGRRPNRAIEFASLLTVADNLEPRLRLINMLDRRKTKKITLFGQLNIWRFKLYINFIQCRIFLIYFLIIIIIIIIIIIMTIIIIMIMIIIIIII